MKDEWLRLKAGSFKILWSRFVPHPSSFILCLLLLSGCPEVIQEDVLVGSLSGHVAAEGGPTNLANADVFITSGKAYEPKDVTRFAARTDAFGKFTITGIHQGWVTIKLQSPGFAPLLRTVQIKRDGVKFVDLVLGYGKSRPNAMTVLFERDYDIWLSDEKGVRQVNLTRDLDKGFNKQYPNWAPDRQSFTFFRWQRGQAMSPPGIWECRADVTECRQLSAMPQVIHSLARSPANPNQFLFSMASPDGNSSSQIYLLDVAQRQAANLSGVLAVSIEETPAWAPDGQRYAYTSYVNERPQIFTYVLKGGARRQLTGEVPGTSTRPASDQGENRDPAWSPNGDHIAFVSNRSGQSQIWMMNADGSGTTQVTNLPHGSCASPVWSPDGLRLLFNTTYLQKNPGRPNAELWVVSVDGRDLRMVTNDALHATW